MKKEIVIGLLFLSMSGHLFSAGDAVLLRMEGEDQRARVEARVENSDRWIAIASGYRENEADGWMKIALPEGYDEADLRVKVSDTVSRLQANKIGQGILSDEYIKLDFLEYPLISTYGNSYKGMEDFAIAEGEEAIEEADIWAWQEDSLFFYNQYRGLQLIDMSDSADPVMLDTFRYPARGENMYSLGDGKAVLVGTGNYSDASQLTVEFIRYDGEKLDNYDTVSIPQGSYLDSRRYGDYLYLLTRTYSYYMNVDQIYEYSEVVHLYSVSLKDGDTERVKAIREFESYGSYNAIISAQPGVILISVDQQSDEAVRPTRHSEVHVLEPLKNGDAKLLGTAVLAGKINDKYKLNYADGILTTISQYFENGWNNVGASTYLENFQLGATGYSRIGHLDFAPGERLFASRFYGSAIYIVTFRFVDPLFAVDNSNPAEPVIAGELVVPGWSDYIEWVDGQLFAIGTEDNKVSVSIFDVEDPKNMALKDRVYLGEDSWASSEAQYDDQAISFYPEKKLMMLPFTVWTWRAQTPTKAMQLISWDDEGLALRGQIQHLDRPRRGIFNNDSVVTISGYEIITTDISDPDTPTLSSKTPVAWKVNALFEKDDYLLQIGSSQESWYYPVFRIADYYYPTPGKDSYLTVTTKEKPNTPEAQLSLTDDYLCGSVLLGDKLVVLDRSEKINTESNLAVNYGIKVFDVSDPLNPSLFAKTDYASEIDLGNSFQANLTSDGSIVWSSTASSGFGYAYFYAFDYYPYYNSRSSYITTVFDESGKPTIAKAFGYESSDYAQRHSAWVWNEPFLFMTTGIYDHYYADGFDYYKTTNTLFAVDFSVVSEPIQYAEISVPSQLSAVKPVPQENGWYLYFAGSSNYIQVWGWDEASAFKLFEQSFVDLSAYENSAEGYHVYTSSVALKDGYNVRSLTSSGNSQNNLLIQGWYHDELANKFIFAGEYDLENNYIRDTQFEEDAFFLLGDKSLYKFSLYDEEPVLTLDENLVLPFPNLFDRKIKSSIINEDGVFLPSTMYGIDYLAFSEKEIPSSSLVQRSLKTASDDWKILEQTSWARVDKEESASGGKLSKMRWLYKPDTTVTIDASAMDGGDNWHESSWFGWYANMSSAPRWIQHLEHGPMWVLPADGTEQAGFYFADMNMGYFWTQKAIYPWLYSYAEQSWMYYLKDTGTTGKRWFYDLKSGWISR